MNFFHTLSRAATMFSCIASIGIITSCQDQTSDSADESTIQEEAITHIACGSCYRPTSKNAEVWGVIGASKPQLFLFMGDNIYADTEDLTVMQKKYAQLLNLKSYQNFAQSTKILPTWDDHDYGANDAGVEYPKKKESQQIFLDTFDFAKNHPAREQEGIYHSFLQGPQGKRLQVINLDTRYHRSPIVRKKIGKLKSYIPNKNPDATILGETQWQWLEQELKKPADLRIIVSSIQIITEDHGYEKWANIPAERLRFFELLKKTKANRVILLSGDRHLAEFSTIKPEESGLDYDLVEMTSSGMTHAGAWNHGNSHRIKGSYYNKRNYGLIDINWTENAAPEVKLKIKSLIDSPENVFSETTVKFE